MYCNHVESSLENTSGNKVENSNMRLQTTSSSGGSKSQIGTIECESTHNNTRIKLDLFPPCSNYLNEYMLVNQNDN